jgi:hypothetical protein
LQFAYGIVSLFGSEIAPTKSGCFFLLWRSKGRNRLLPSADNEDSKDQRIIQSSKWVSKMGSYLYASPSFLSGAARLLDFGNTYDTYNQTVTGSQADSLGLLWDWAAVGDDLWQSIDTYQGAKTEQSHRPAEKAQAELVTR